jgi:hypothetical protein
MDRKNQIETLRRVIIGEIVRFSNAWSHIKSSGPTYTWTPSQIGITACRDNIMDAIRWARHFEVISVREASSLLAELPALHDAAQCAAPLRDVSDDADAQRRFLKYREVCEQRLAGLFKKLDNAAERAAPAVTEAA